MRTLTVTPAYPHENCPTEALFIEHQTRALQQSEIPTTVMLAKPWLPDTLAQILPRYQPLWKLPKREPRAGIDTIFTRYLHIPQYRQPQATVRLCAAALAQNLRKYDLESSFDIIHAHGAWPVGLAAPVIASALALPLIVTLHIRDDPRLYTSAPGRTLYSRMFQQADAIVTVGRPLDRFLVELGFEGCKLRIPNGIDLQTIDDAIRGVNCHSQEWGQLVSVSNLWSIKGIDCNLFALARLKEKGIYWKNYTIVGEGPERTYLEGLSEDLGIADRVVFVGRLPNHDALRRVAEADIFTLPSWQEAFGVVYLEAMACSKPIIGCRGQGPQDIFEHNRHGLLIDPPNGDDREPMIVSLTLALEKLLMDRRLAAAMGAAGREKAGEFTWTSNAASYASLFEETIAKKRKFEGLAS